jgi:hypothetical protein
VESTAIDEKQTAKITVYFGKIKRKWVQMFLELTPGIFIVYLIEVMCSPNGSDGW